MFARPLPPPDLIPGDLHDAQDRRRGRARGAVRAPRGRAGAPRRGPVYRREVPGLRAGRRSADLPRRPPDHLHPPPCGPDGRRMGHRGVDHERRRLPQPVPPRGLERALVARRHAHRLPRPRRAGGIPDLRSMDGCGGRHLPGHPRDRSDRRHRLVAGREVHRLQHGGACAQRAEDHDARGAEGREMDAGAALRGPDALPLRPTRLPRTRLPAPLRRPRRWRDAARGDERRVEHRRHDGRAGGERRVELVRRRPDDGVRRRSRCPTARATSPPRTSRRGACAGSRARRARGRVRWCRPTGGRSRSAAIPRCA